MTRLLAVLTIVFALSGLQGFADDRATPTALVFPVTAGVGAMPDQAAAATQAIRTYFSEGGKLETMMFDPQSSVIRRAMTENGLKAVDLVGTDSPTTRVKIGKLVGVDYVVTGTLKYGSSIKFELWMANVRSQQVWGFEGDGPIAETGKRELAISNAIQMATSRAITGVGEVVLKDVQASAKVMAGAGHDQGTPSLTDIAPAAEDAKAHVQRAEDARKSGDMATAIQEYRRAIDSDPKNVAVRVKLAELYTGRQMYAESLDELSRAQAVDPKNEAIAQELERVRKLRTGVEPAQQAQAGGLSSTDPSNPSRVTVHPSGGRQSDVSAGDALWRNKNFLEAEKRYRLAVGLDDSSVIAHERLGLLMVALGRFDAAKTEVLKLRELEPKLDAKSSGDRYDRFEGFVVRHIRLMVQEYDTNALGFAGKSLTREDYYAKAQSLSTRVEALIRLNDVLAPSEAGASAYNHQTAGLSLMSQALTHLVTYLESNKKNESDSAAIMMAEARKHVLSGSK